MTEKTKIDIALLLPTVPDARDACVQRLSDLLSAKEGIETAHLAEAKDKGHESICIHYDPNRLSIGEVRDLAGRAGAELDERFGHLLLHSDTMFGQQALTVEARARKMAGVLDAAVSPAGIVRIEFDREATDDESIRAELRNFGVRITEKTIAPQPSDASEAGPKAAAKELGHGGLLGERTELLFAALCGGLVKGGAPLENLGRLGAIAFDKTGTLTEGKPRLTDVVSMDGVTEVELLRVAIAVEALSDHPLAPAVVLGGKERLKSDSVLQAHDMQSITGRGVLATVDGRRVYIGKDSLFTEVEGPPLPDAIRESVEKLKASGRTTMIVRRGDTYLGVLGLMDTPRDAAKDVILRLRALGIRRMIMLSSDNQQVANAVAKAVGIDEALGDLMPDDKVNAIKKLNKEGGVAMVGDGVNDAPAMANATVGIAMGAAGSDVALETADVALMADDLNHLPFAVGLSRQTSRLIGQNRWLSLGALVDFSFTYAHNLIV